MTALAASPAPGAPPRHLLDVDDLTRMELQDVLALGRADATARVLEGEGAALLFEKPSARTRHSTEMAVVQLGGHPVYVRPEEVGLDVREATEDVIRTLMQYHSVVCARVFDHHQLERMAAVSSVPVVNLLSDRAHPLQAIADVLTLQAEFGDVTDRTLAWVGDFNNVIRSLALAATAVGMHVRVATPAGHGPTELDVDRIGAIGSGSFAVAPDPVTAVDGADAVVTDTWVSMGQEDEAASRVDAFAGFTVDDSLLGGAAAHAVFLHCLPAHRGEEVTDAVLDGPRSRVWPEAANRLNAARASLAWLLGVRV